MKIVCIGGGPAGLYLAILARLRSDGRDEVVVAERNPPGEASGFAVTLGEDILDELYRTDPVGADGVRAAAHVWGDQVVEVAGETVHLGGRYGYSIGRARLLEALTVRARQVGVDLRFDTETAPDGDLAADPLTADADVVVAADGINSAVRDARTAEFGTRLTHGTNRYAWFGTSKTFEAFTFAFERTEAGWIWFHAYPAADCVSTCIVECTPQTWAGLGLDRLSADEGMRLLETIFARSLEGHSLIAPPGTGASPWLEFREIRNTSWRSGNVVLAGDAAHTTHFAIGSGTVLAVADAIVLAEELYPDGTTGRTADVDAALAGYDARRRTAMAPTQDMARRSMRWFEEVPQRLEGADAIDFSWSLLDRRGDQGPLHRRLHEATQIEPVRRVRRRLTSARRVHRALRRGEIDPIGVLTGRR
ncbi:MULTISPECIES: FAD-dependent monooxygenase [Pseudonocardia]|uniref:FAD-binding monooxygenase n=2 Tax=Pseudonocardia TaxID=1847 RepID=A0ABQ0SA41_9PSEU|nr:MULTISPECIES: FAD-dependent monooxygenase [Pseudonocardia]OSY34546.1 putative tryptophan hydroxylase VioD [Pseudonocardia autotrophica]TDN65571.1 2-polyprenyl-6-methoxyphenol hydroxylase-like FAD-dependent oxidoreductase [Pseudonocardia autotrophica]BBG05705.1 FAD-binding monooxygenase [Pseudonocardia autotrophica]GEC29778.1 FAD-binding monooxygenase [Pseudonocardia saturnea]